MDIKKEFEEFIQKSELAQAFRDKKRKDLTSNRQKAIDALQPLEIERIDITDKMRAAKKRYADDHERLIQELKVLDQQAGAEIVNLLTQSNAIEREIDTLQAYLRINYEQEIADAIKFFIEKMEEVRTEPISRSEIVTDRKLSGKAETTAYSNTEAVLSCLAYCKSAVSELESMKISTAECDVVRIEALKAGLPDYKEISEKKGYGLQNPFLE